MVIESAFIKKERGSGTLSTVKTLITNSSFTDDSGDYVTLRIPAYALNGKDKNPIIKAEFINKLTLEPLLSLASNEVKLERAKDEFGSLQGVHFIMGSGDGSLVHQLYFDLLEFNNDWVCSVAENIVIKIYFDVSSESGTLSDSLSKIESEISFTNQLLISNGHTLKNILSYTWYQYLCFIKALSYQSASKDANNNLNLFSAVAHAGASIMGSSKSAKAFEKHITDKLNSQQKKIQEM